MDRICNDCGKPYILTKSERSYYFKKHLPVPCQCRACLKAHWNSPQLWYINNKTDELESVTVLHNDGENIVILYRGKQHQMDVNVVGKRLFQSINEARKCRPRGRQI